MIERIQSRFSHPFPLRSLLFRRCGLAGAVVVLLLLPAPGRAQGSVPVGMPILQVDRAEQDYLFIRGLVTDGLYPTALDQVRAWLERNPDGRRLQEVRLLEAEVHFLQANFGRTVDLLRAFVLTWPQSPYLDRALYRRGEAQFKLGNYAAAEADFVAIEIRSPESEFLDQARYWMGESRLRLGEFQGARQAYQSVYRKNPDSAVADYALYSLGWIAQEEEGYGEALQYYRRLVDEYPRSDLVSHSLFKMGQCYFALAQYAEAADGMVQVLQLDLGADVHAGARFLLGESYYHLEEYALARRHYEQVLREYPEQETAAEAQVAIGWTLLKEANYTAAAEAFSEAVERFPDTPSAAGALYRSGIAWREAGQHEKAVEAFTGVAERYGSSEWGDDALLEAGVIRFRQEAYGPARQLFDRLLRMHPRSPLAADAAELVGECLLAEDDFGGAEEAYDRVLRDWPGSAVAPLALFQRSYSQFRNGRIDAARAGFAEYRSHHPSGELQADALFFEAEAAYRLESFQESGRLYRSYLQAHPGGARALAAAYGVGWSHLSLGEYPPAIESFRQVAAAREGDPELIRDAHLRIGDAYYNQRQFRDAAVTYRDVFLRHPDRSDAHQVAFMAGDAFIRAEQFEAALTILGQIVTRFPRSPHYDDALYWRGWALFRRGEFDRAIAEYRQVLAQQPPGELVPHARYGIADAHYNAGRYQDALEAYRVVAEQHANEHWLAEAVGGMQWSLIQLGRPAEAEQVSGRMITPATPPALRERVQLQQGKFLFNQGRLAEAVESLRTLAEGGTGDTEAQALYWTGRAHQQGEEPARAETAYIRLLQRHPDANLAEDARVRLGELQLARAAHGEAVRTLEPLLDRAGAARARALYLSARAHRALGDLSRTEIELGRLVEEYPGSPLAAQGRLRLAELAIERRTYNIAQTHLNAVMAERTDELAAEAQFLAGELLFAQQKWSDAEVQYLKVKYVYPAFGSWIGRAQLQAAEANLRLERPDKARTLLDSIIKDYPGTAVAEQARRMLERLPR